MMTRRALLGASAAGLMAGMGGKRTLSDSSLNLQLLDGDGVGVYHIEWAQCPPAANRNLKRAGLIRWLENRFVNDQFCSSVICP